MIKLSEDRKKFDTELKNHKQFLEDIVKELRKELDNRTNRKDPEIDKIVTVNLNLIINTISKKLAEEKNPLTRFDFLMNRSNIILHRLRNGLINKLQNNNLILSKDNWLKNNKIVKQEELKFKAIKQNEKSNKIINKEKIESKQNKVKSEITKKIEFEIGRISLLEKGITKLLEAAGRHDIIQRLYKTQPYLSDILKIRSIDYSIKQAKTYLMENNKNINYNQIKRTKKRLEELKKASEPSKYSKNVRSFILDFYNEIEKESNINFDSYINFDDLSLLENLEKICPKIKKLTDVAT